MIAVVSTKTQFILTLFIDINYCIIFHMNNYKPTFAPLYIFKCEVAREFC